MKTARVLSLSVLLLPALLLAAACQGDSNPAAPQGSGTVAAAGIQEINIQVEGMSCEGCASSIKTAVGELPGVQNCDVQVKEGRVQVRFDPQQVDQPKIYAAITSQGYKPVKNI